MADYFFDSSALVKRYVREVGSDWVGQLTDPPAGHVTARLFSSCLGSPLSLPITTTNL